MMLSTVAAERKELPLYSGCIAYFPDALVAVAELSRIGNDQHNPGKPLHWDRSKSGDELDALMRHLLEAGTLDTDDVRHSTKVAWRALANLQKEIENAERKERASAGHAAASDRRSNDPCPWPGSADDQRSTDGCCNTPTESSGRDADYLGDCE